MPSRRKSVNSGAAGLSIGNEDTIRHDEDLKPDPGTETDLEIEDKQVQLFTRAYEQTSEKLVGISRFWWPCRTGERVANGSSVRLELR
jgi:hypothetical protein